MTLSPHFHRHLQSSHFELLYNDSSDFPMVGSIPGSLLPLTCLAPVAILLEFLQRSQNVALSNGVSFLERGRSRKEQGQANRDDGHFIFR